MRLLRGLHNPGIGQAGCVATIGNFDGVHLGHQAIIEQVVAKAEALSLPSVAIVFEPQPLEFFNAHEAPARLYRFRDKYQVLAELRLDYVFCLKFDQALSQLSAEDFVKQVLARHLNLRHLVIGDDFRFGGDRQGDFALLKNMGKALGFGLDRTPTQVDEQGGGQRVSSTRIREVLAAGDFKLANALLGRPYRIAGKVMHGEALGRKLGFPTANIALQRVRSPLAGVYAVKLIREGQAGSRCESYAAVANIGVKPSVGHFRPSLEVHVLDFDAALYGERVEVEFCQKIREEQRFDSLELLVQQIKQDILAAREILAE